MPDTSLPDQPYLRSPFVAQLIAHALLDGLMEWTRDLGFVASPPTLETLQALRRQIDVRVHRADRTQRGDEAAPASLAELLAFNERLAVLQIALAYRQAFRGTAFHDPRQGTLPFDDPPA